MIEDTFNSELLTAIAAIATILGAIAAWVGLKKRGKKKTNGGKNTSVKTGNIQGHVTIVTGDQNTIQQSAYNPEKESKRTEWKIYEAAFLWHGIEPPGVHAHFEKMTREIEETKEMLHEAVNNGQLKIVREDVFQNGITRYVSREDLKKFAKSINQKPHFLFG